MALSFILFQHELKDVRRLIGGGESRIKLVLPSSMSPPTVGNKIERCKISLWRRLSEVQVMYRKKVVEA